MTERLGYGFTLARAIDLAQEYHRDQKDISGRPYIEHLLAVKNQLQGEDAQMAGVMHDIIEDTGMTFAILEALGCPQHIMEAISLVSHGIDFGGSEEEYFADIRKVAKSGNQIAIDVKWADLTHNLDPKRIPNPSKHDLKRWEKYKKAKEILKPLVSPYLSNKP